ncbi:MAG: (Fe-S)-binding protein [Desulfobacterales bacterium]
MEIFKLLEKSNCRECNEPTCLAFAAAVFKGQRQINECTRLDKETILPCAGRIPCFSRWEALSDVRSAACAARAEKSCCIGT